jgi:hypothetical protein
MSEPALPESVLCAAYTQELDCYTKALEAARRLLPDLQQGSAGIESLQQLLVHLEDVAAIERRIGRTKDQWKLTGAKPSAALQRLLARLADLIKRLTDSVEQAERQAQLQRDSLIPQLDAANRGRLMQQAYGRRG